MLTATAVLLTFALIVWLIVRAVRGQGVKAHNITYGLAVITGVYTVAFFLSMDIPQLFKVVVSILLGMAFIYIAAGMERRREAQK
jgi:hypothetical protein